MTCIMQHKHADRQPDKRALHARAQSTAGSSDALPSLYKGPSSEREVHARALGTSERPARTDNDREGLSSTRT